MGALDQSILQAVDAIAKSNVKASNATLTIECTIIDVEDAGQQLYRVKYKDNSFVVTSSSGTYSVGDIVYVLVPEGDFSKTKMILGAVTTSSTNLADSETADDYVITGDNFFKNLDPQYNLCSYHTSENIIVLSDEFKNLLIKNIEDGERSFIFSAQMKTELPPEQQLNGDYGLILTIPILRDPGTGKTVEEDLSSWQKDIIINIDKHTIIGNPYKLEIFTTQTIEQTMNKDYIIDYSADKKPTLKIFVKDFIQSDDDTKKADIFIRNIVFNPISYLNEEDKTGYKLFLNADTGRFFMSNSAEEKKLIPDLKINGRTTKLSGDKYDCYWFVEDASISTDSEYYLQSAGIGQKCLNDKAKIETQDDGSQTTQQITNVFTYTVKRTDVKAKLRYKCVIVSMEQKISTSAIITMVNNESSILCELVSATGVNNFARGIGTVELIARVTWNELSAGDKISLAWNRMENGLPLSTEEFTIKNISQKDGYFEEIISFPVSIVENVNTIFCTFYWSKIENGILRDKKTLGTDSLTITSSIQDDQFLTIQNGDVLYKYDGNGNSPFVADYAYPYQTIKTIMPLTQTIYKPGMIELSESEKQNCKVTWYIPKNSLIKVKDAEDGGDYQVIKQNSKNSQLNYTIADVYNPNKTDNTIILKVKVKDDLELEEEAVIKIVKEGETGTNGSRYTGMLAYKGIDEESQTETYFTYDELDGGKLKRLQLAYIKDKGWYYNENGTIGGKMVSAAGKNFNFKAKVYCDGDLLDEGKYEVNQVLFDSVVTNPVLTYGSAGEQKTGNFIIKPGHTINDTSEMTTAIQAEIKVGNVGTTCSDDEGENGVQEIIYAHYPVEIIYINMFNEVQEDPFDIDKTNMPYIKGGFTSVVYASDGSNPQFDNTNPFELNNDISLMNDYSDCQSYSQSQSKNIINGSIVSSETPQLYKAKPITKFDNGDSLNYVKVTLSPKDSKKKKVENDINKLEGDISDKNTEIGYLNKCFSDVKTFFNALQEIDDKTGTVIGTVFEKIKKDLSKDNIKGFLKARTEALLSLEDVIQQVLDNKDITSSTWYNSTLKTLLKERQDIWAIGNVTENVKKYINDIPPIEITFGIADVILEEDNLVVISHRIPVVNDNIDKIKEKSVITPFSDYTKDFNKKLKAFKKTAEQGSKKNAQQFVNVVQDIINITNKVLKDKEIDFSKLAKYGFFQDLVNQESIYNSSVKRLYSPQSAITEKPDEIPDDCEKYITKMNEFYGDDYPLIDSYVKINDLLDSEQELINTIGTDYSKDIEYYQSLIIAIKNQVEAEKKKLEQELDFLNYILEQFNTPGIIVNHPVMMRYNTYEMTNVMGQDGTKLYIDQSDDPQYLLAPQIGAGKKSPDGKTFTGMIMGLRGFAKDTTGKSTLTGLFGYHNSVQTMFLNAEDGSAIFGKSGGGQIIIDPNAAKRGGDSSGLLYSSNYFGSYGNDGKPDDYTNITGQGLLINLTKAYLHFGDKNGEDGSIPGRLYSGEHNEIHSNKEGFFLSRDGLSIGGKAYIGKDGVLRLGNKATSKNTTKNDCQEISSGSYVEEGKEIEYSYIGFKTDKKGFTVSKEGTKITGITINGSDKEVYIGTDGIRLGSKFAVDPDGNVGANYIIAKGGTIGGQTIDTTKLISKDGKMEINSNGSIKGGSVYEQSIDTLGNAKFNNITCNHIFTITDGGKNTQSNDGDGNFSQSFGGTAGTSGNQTLSKDSFNISNGETPYMKMDSAQGLMLNGSQVKMYDVKGNPVLGTYIANLAVGTLEAENILVGSEKGKHVIQIKDGKITAGSIDVTSVIDSPLFTGSSIRINRLAITEDATDLNKHAFTIGTKRIARKTVTIGSNTLNYLGQEED